MQKDPQVPAKDLRGLVNLVFPVGSSKNKLWPLDSKKKCDTNFSVAMQKNNGRCKLFDG